MMSGYSFQSTEELSRAIQYDPDDKLFSGCKLEWSESEFESLMAILRDVPQVDDSRRKDFINALGDILCSQAYNLKSPIWKARKDPNRPYGPHDDIKLINLALNDLSSAAEHIECLSISYGLRAIPGEVHPRIKKCIDELDAALRQIAEEFPNAVHGIRKFEKDQKIRLATRIALAYRKFLGLNPTSTNDGPYFKLFFECSGFLCLPGGRWGDFYQPAFQRLGLSRTDSSSST